MEALPALRIGYGALACHTSLVIDRLRRPATRRVLHRHKQKPRDIARGIFVRLNADRLGGGSLPLPAPAKQTQRTEAETT